MQIKNAAIKWLESGEPYSLQFEDIYFSNQGGLEESEYVFVSQNQLAQRCLNTDSFTIAELGFGSGLNFLATLKTWQNIADNHCHLNYISFEQYPFSAADFNQMGKLIENRWPELSIYYQELLSQYSTQHSPLQLRLCAAKVSLTLIFDEAFKQLKNSDCKKLLPAVDAWYLDGFSPPLNTSLWNENIYQQLVSYSRPGTTFSTYTAAGHVRRGLIAAGFTVEKYKGFGEKRDMLKGVLP